MRQLGEDEAVVAVHGVGDLPIAGNDGVVVVGDLLPGRRRGGRMHARGPAEDREGAPAPCLRLMVAREPRRRPAALGHGLGVAGGVDPVLEGDGAHPDRREERTKLVGHGRSLPNTGRLPPPATARLPRVALTYSGCAHTFAEATSYRSPGVLGGA